MFEVSALAGADISRLKLNELIDINKKSVYYNLALSEEDILNLLSARNAHLKYSERIEFGCDTLEAIINAFYKSPYINQFEYTAILNELQFIFYIIKNEVGGFFPDEELIELMAELFNGVCAGSLELLKGKGAEYIFELAKHRKREVEKSGEYVKEWIGGGSDVSISFEGIDEAKLRGSLSVLLEELALKYTKGTSFSIRAETAENIIMSIMYAARIAGESSVSLDKLRDAYYNGLAIIEELLMASRKLYAAVKKTRTETSLKCYNETIEGIESFFNYYDKEFASTIIPAQISYYPVLCDTRLEGAELIKDFLQCLLIENRICGLFDKLYTEILLDALEEKEGMSRELLRPNIFEIAVTNGIFAAALGKRDILLSRDDREALESILKEDGIIEKAVGRFIQYYGIENDIEAVNYIEKYVLSRQKNKKAYGALTAEAAVIAEKSGSGFLLYGNKMDNRLFRELTCKLNAESRIEEKLKIMRESVNSLEDVIDLLNAGIFSGFEYRAFFDSMNAEERWILFKAVSRALKDTDALRVSLNDAWVKEFYKYNEGW